MTDTPMEAGRELDEMIAENVMGIVPRDVRVRGEVDTPLVRMWTTSDYWQDGQHDRYTLNMNSAPKRRYSTDIAAAMEVVEVMRAKGCWPEMKWIEDWDRVAKWLVDFHPAAGVHDERAATLPLAICLAALKAIGSGRTTESNKPASRPQEEVK